MDCGLVCLEFRGVFAYVSRARGLPVVGRLALGRVRAGHVVVGRGSNLFSLFLKELEIALYFNF